MRVNVSLSNEFLTKLKEKAKEKSMSISEYIRFALTILWERGV